MASQLSECYDNYLEFLSTMLEESTSNETSGNSCPRRLWYPSISPPPSFSQFVGTCGRYLNGQRMRDLIELFSFKVETPMGTANHNSATYLCRPWLRKPQQSSTLLIMAGKARSLPLMTPTLESREQHVTLGTTLSRRCRHGSVSLVPSRLRCLHLVRLASLK